MKYKSVLVLNEGFSDNLGDQAINESIHHLLKVNGLNDVKFHDFTKKLSEPSKISTMEQAFLEDTSILVKLSRLLPVKLRWLIINLKRVIKVSNHKYDQVIIGGGQLVLSNGTFPMAMFCWVFFLKLFGNKSITICGVGLGTKFSFIDRLLFKYSLMSLSKIYIRDEKSQLILKNLFKVKSEFIYDVAFIHNKSDHQVEHTYEYESLLGVISYSVYEKYAQGGVISKDEFFETWITLLSEYQIPLQTTKLFYTTKEDREASLEFKNYVQREYQINLPLIETNTLDMLIENISCSKVIISARMHALILAFTYNRNITVYPISGKLIEFKNMIDSGVVLEGMQELIESQFTKLLDGKYDGSK